MGTLSPTPCKDLPAFDPANERRLLKYLKFVLVNESHL